MAQCKFIKADGEQCRAKVKPRRKWCIAHDPKQRHKFMAARVAGHNTVRGVRTSEPEPVETEADLQKAVAAAIAGMRAGTIAVDRGDAILRGCKLQREMMRQREADQQSRWDSMTDEELIPAVRAELALLEEVVTPDVRRSDAGPVPLAVV